MNNRLSDILRQLGARQTESIALGELTMTLKERGFGVLMIMLCLPNLVPMPPGVSTVLGIPLILIAGQLAIGYRRPLLPRRLRYKEIAMQSFRAAIGKVVPWIERFERLANPRLWYLPQPLAERLIGMVALAMGLILILPIPFGNFLPATAVILISLGLWERDGVWAGAGIALAIVSAAIAIGVVGTAGLALERIF